MKHLARQLADYLTYILDRLEEEDVDMEVSIAEGRELLELAETALARHANGEPFRIPILDIKASITDLPHDSRLEALKLWLDNSITDLRDVWGVQGRGYNIEYRVDQREWFPVFLIHNKQLADVFLAKLARRKACS